MTRVAMVIFLRSEVKSASEKALKQSYSLLTLPIMPCCQKESF
jgi:hypothetical protein